jgi:hypothetical protein
MSEVVSRPWLSSFDNIFKAAAAIEGRKVVEIRMNLQENIKKTSSFLYFVFDIFVCCVRTHSSVQRDSCAGRIRLHFHMALELTTLEGATVEIAF